jgi:hypothetical protein
MLMPLGSIAAPGAVLTALIVTPASVPEDEEAK